MKFIKNNLFWLLLTLFSASTDTFVVTVCLIAVRRGAQFRGEQDVVDVGELVRPLVSVHRLVLLLPDMYRLLYSSVHSVAFSVDEFGLSPMYDVVQKEGLSRGRNVNNSLIKQESLANAR